MKANPKWAMLRFMLLLSALSVLLSGCFVFRGHDDDRDDDHRGARPHEYGQDHHDDFEDRQ
jgi:outer membrane biogenesis lipoprotein LolB